MVTGRKHMVALNKMQHAQVATIRESRLFIHRPAREELVKNRALPFFF